jgi:2-keto-4-pentenoate hydratase/2-oxohepta-3-ene-1,7-dioic acid hydratase in catechol pathway
MKLVRFVDAKHACGVYGLAGEDGAVEILASDLFAPVQRTGEVIQERDILRYLPPVDPPNILALGLNYWMHVAEGHEQPPERPLLFLKATTSLSAHKRPIVLPEAAPDGSDYEAELGVIIGRLAKNVQVENALDYVFGYTCANDISARDCQIADGQWARGKSFDTYCPIGPYVATELDPGDLHIQMRLNGQVMQDDSTKSMVFGVAAIVSYLSRGMTLLPGTLILTGTPGGVGNARKPPIFLRPGDLCEVEIEGIGTLQNEVVTASATTDAT